MPRLLSVKEGTRGVVLRVECEDGCVTYNVSVGQYSSLGSPVRGTLLDSDEAERIKEWDEQRRGFKKALYALSFSDRSSRELYRKLRNEGFSHTAAEGAVEECLRLGYIDERRQLCRLVLKEANQMLRGPMYIKRKLAGRGYSTALIGEVIGELAESGEIDFASNFDRLCDKRGATEPEARHRLRHLYGYR